MNILSSRQLKAGELIKRTLAEIFYSGKIFDKDLANVSITISEVRISPDLRVAKVYVSPLGGLLNKDLFMESLSKQAHNLRYLLTQKVRLKYSPELVFVYDDSFDNVKKINSLIDSAL
ncbi:Ribosome-binding factor A [Candidatus Arcanobacter lacustris]|jgi:ribosome-binding factor A|uniref:Ribosome-binding factor A n=1 Tax=Candidatus Arcanibacter lacustris TaxID=1607817 RepID=A0A0F5MNI9_9RICK|nr:Ribosome-binding factor A [Candidatus Arcanobacter lacustris]